MRKPQTILIAGEKVEVRTARAEEIIDLRHRVLRAGLPREEAMFPGDELSTSHHFAAFDGHANAIGCATFHLNSWQNETAYQLRGMATDKAWAGKGVGTAVVNYAMQAMKELSPVRLFWCNARLIAIPFYQKLGWKIMSDRFEIPTAGPHHRMVFIAAD